MPFQFTELALPGVVLIEPRVFADDRGFFMETYKREDYASAGLNEPFVQENHSRSRRGTLRGLHFQRSPRAQGKLVRAVSGVIFDVAVDTRPESATFGQWAGVVLSAENRAMLYVPPWCAHGFCVVSEEAEIVYKVTAEYSPEHEGGVIWNDPDVCITWPISAPVLSARDQRWPTLARLSGAIHDERRTPLFAAPGGV
jgi:dTDP-4-dehydrorhamnose 3,5-epimerase